MTGKRHDSEQDPAVRVLPLPPGPGRDIAVARQLYLQALLYLRRTDPDWETWLADFEREALERSLAGPPHDG